MNAPNYQPDSRFGAILSKLNISNLLYTVLGLLSLCVAATFVSRYIMNESLAQSRTAEHLMFEITYGHNYIVRDVDVTMRGFGIINDERYLYRSNEYIAIDLENNFKRLDSLLSKEQYSDPNGLAAIARYKHYIRSFVRYHRKMTELVREGRHDEFVKEFGRDSSATMWPVFTRAVEEVSKHERELSQQAIEQYKFFSLAVVYVQVLTLLLTIPLVSMIFSRLRNERRTSKILEERKLIDERNKVKENMLSVMSHEIRTPLNSMIGLTHVLKHRNPRPDQIEIIDTLKTSGDHLLHLVNEILDYNKIQSNKLDLEFLNFNLIEILKQLHAMFAGSAEDKGITFSVQMSTALPTIVKGDSTRLLQILSNLVSNAIKFTSEGSVTLYATPFQVERDSCSVEFRLEDTGIGIAKDKLDHLYEPFTQLESGAHRKYGGSGLGLLIVKNLVEVMQGKLHISSIEGKTTTITVTLPFSVAIENSETLPSKMERAHSLQGLEVLYIEDVASNQFLIKTLLSDYSIGCTIAKDGVEAIADTAARKYDVILLDVQLPDMEGYELAKIVRHSPKSKNHHTPIIVFSAHTGMNEQKIKEAGADDFLAKPFHPEDLMKKIERWAARKR